MAQYVTAPLHSQTDVPNSVAEPFITVAMDTLTGVVAPRNRGEQTSTRQITKCHSQATLPQSTHSLSTAEMNTLVGVDTSHYRGQIESAPVLEPPTTQRNQLVYPFLPPAMDSSLIGMEIPRHQDKHMSEYQVNNQSNTETVLSVTMDTWTEVESSGNFVENTFSGQPTGSQVPHSNQPADSFWPDTIDTFMGLEMPRHQGQNMSTRQLSGSYRRQANVSNPTDSLSTEEINILTGMGTPQYRRQYTSTSVSNPQTRQVDVAGYQCMHPATQSTPRRRSRNLSSRQVTRTPISQPDKLSSLVQADTTDITSAVESLRGRARDFNFYQQLTSCTQTDQSQTVNEALLTSTTQTSTQRRNHNISSRQPTGQQTSLSNLPYSSNNYLQQGSSLSQYQLTGFQMPELLPARTSTFPSGVTDISPRMETPQYQGQHMWSSLSSEGRPMQTNPSNPTYPLTTTDPSLLDPSTGVLMPQYSSQYLRPQFSETMQTNVINPNKILSTSSSSVTEGTQNLTIQITRQQILQFDMSNPTEPPSTGHRIPQYQNEVISESSLSMNRTSQNVPYSIDQYLTETKILTDAAGYQEQLISAPLSESQNTQRYLNNPTPLQSLRSSTLESDTADLLRQLESPPVTGHIETQALTEMPSYLSCNIPTPPLPENNFQGELPNLTAYPSLAAAIDTLERMENSQQRQNEYNETPAVNLSTIPLPTQINVSINSSVALPQYQSTTIPSGNVRQRVARQSRQL